MELAHMANTRFMMTILALLILTVVGAPGTQRFFHSTGFLQVENVVWAQTCRDFPEFNYICYARQQISDTRNACDEFGP